MKTDNPPHICCIRGEGAAAIGTGQWVLQKIENPVKSGEPAHLDFLSEYGRAVLLALKEQGVLTEGQLVLCLERLPPAGQNGQDKTCAPANSVFDTDSRGKGGEPP